MIKLPYEIIDVQPFLYFENEYTVIYFCEKEGYILCIAKAAFIPIDEFMNIFKKNTELAKTNKFKKFIFDKRSLRAFHQPSMEWYYIEWKQEVFENGIDKHYKILPHELWFQRAVEAGKAQILKDYPENILHQVDIRYFDSIKNALEHDA